MLYTSKRTTSAEVIFLIVAIVGLIFVWLSASHMHPIGFQDAGLPVDQNPHQQEQFNPSTLSVPDALAENHPRAFIIETEVTASLIPLMLHFSSVLGPSWTIVLFTLEDLWVEPSSPAFRRAIAAKRFEVHFLPSGTQLKDSGSVSRFLTKPWIWEQLQTAHRVLMFQLDSIICSKSAIIVENFFNYDFVGAPIDERYGRGFNGGLSLRNPSLFLKITQEVDFESSGAEFEDQWFYEQAKAREDEGVVLPSVEVSKTFSVESIYYDAPLGYHQPSRWQADKMNEIEAWCPEVRMLINRRAT